MLFGLSRGMSYVVHVIALADRFFSAPRSVKKAQWSGLLSDQFKVWTHLEKASRAYAGNPYRKIVPDMEPLPIWITSGDLARRYEGSKSRSLGPTALANEFGRLLALVLSAMPGSR